MGQRRRSLRPFVIRTALLTITLGLLAWTIGTNRGQIRQVIARRPDGRVFALGFGFSLVATLLTFFRWYFLVRALRLPFSIRDAVRLGFLGLVFNIAVPGAVGGDVAKAAFLCREQARKTQAVASVLLDRMVGLLGLLLLAGIAGVVGWSSEAAPMRRLIVIVWAAATLGLLGLSVAFSPGLFSRFGRLVARWGRAAVMAGELHAMAAAYRRRPGAVVGGIALSVAAHAFSVLAFYAAARALVPDGPTPARHMLLVPLVFLSTAVPLPLGALGLGEQVSGRLFRLVGHDGGVVAMMGFRVFQYGMLAVAAAVALLDRPRVRTLTAPALMAAVGGSADPPAPAA